MTVSRYLIIGFLLLAMACKDPSAPAFSLLDAPICIKEKIIDYETDQLEPGAVEVYSWTIDEEIFYFFRFDCCDNFDKLYDADCNYICAPYGGVLGGGDGLCPDFLADEDSIIRQLIWTKPM